MKYLAVLVLALGLAGLPASASYRTTDVLPLVDNTYSLGSATFRWQNLSLLNELRWYSTTNYLGLKAPALTGTTTWTLPAADGSAGQYLKTNGGALLSWDTPTGTGWAPANSAYVTIGNDATLSAERALTGTANQVTVTDGGANSTVTLSTPQDIGTASTPTFGGATIGALAGYIKGTAGVLSGQVGVPWGDLTSVPSSFTPSAHASTHYSAGSDALAGQSIAGLLTSSGPVFATEILQQADGNPYLVVRTTAPTTARYPSIGTVCYDGTGYGGYTGSYIDLYYGTLGSPSAVPASRTIGQWTWRGYVNSALRTVAAVYGRTSANWAAADYEGELHFGTGDAATWADRMVLNAAGIAAQGGLQVGTLTPPSVAGLGVGTVPTGAGKGDFTGNITTAGSFVSTVAVGTAPLQPTSTTKCTNLNADAVDGVGMPTIAQGDLVYGSAASTLSALAKSTTAGQFLSNSGGSNNPAWAGVTTVTALYTDSADHGTGLNTTEVTLATYTLPASTLAAGKRVSVTVKGNFYDFAGSTSYLRVYFGTQMVAQWGGAGAGAGDTVHYWGACDVMCKGAADCAVGSHAYNYKATSGVGSFAHVQFTKATQDVTAAIVIAVKGLTPDAGDEMTCEFFQVGPVTQ